MPHVRLVAALLLVPVLGCSSERGNSSAAAPAVVKVDAAAAPAPAAAPAAAATTDAQPASGEAEGVPPEATGPESVKGKVWRSDSKQPIANASVHLMKYKAGGGDFGLAGGKPIPAGQAEAFNDVNAGRTENQAAQTTAGDDGAYAFRDIPAGTYAVVATAEFAAGETPCKPMGPLWMSRNPKKQLVVALEAKKGVKVFAIADAIKVEKKVIEVQLDLVCD